MSRLSRLSLKFGALLLFAAFALDTPPASASAAEPGFCGACVDQSVPCGGGQENMNFACSVYCPGTTTAYACTRNASDCHIPFFADGWWCY
jgi:hypothetical protein